MNVCRKCQVKTSSLQTKLQWKKITSSNCDLIVHFCLEPVIYDLIAITILCLSYDLRFIDIYDLTSVNALKNNDKCVYNMYRNIEHNSMFNRDERCKKYCIVTYWTTIQPNNNRPNKGCIQTACHTATTNRGSLSWILKNWVTHDK